MTNRIDLGIDGLTDFQLVGTGGFAETYAAFEVDQGRHVAVKVLRAADAGARRRFDRERRTMGTTTGHPHIVTLFRSGYTPVDDKPYLVMEYLAGGSFQDRLDRSGPLPLDEACQAVAGVAEALGYSHSMGIVHKDVKPANILISATGTAKLTDFGISAIKESTVTSQLSFSMAYCPPEAFAATRDPHSGAVIDHRDERSDLYSLGATLYALVTGVPPYDGSQLTMLSQIAEDPVPSTGNHQLDRFLATAMAKDPVQRHPVAAAFLAGLAEVGRSPERTSVVAPPVAAVPTGEDLASWPAPVGPPPATVTPAGAGRRWVLPVSAGVALVIVAVGFLSLNMLGRNDQPLETAADVGASNPEAPTADGSEEPSDEISPTADITGRPPAADDQVDDDQVDDDQVDDDQAEEGAPAARTPTPTPIPTNPYRYTRHEDAVTSLAQLDDGRIASGGPEGILVWDPANPSVDPIEYDAHTDVVLALTALADGRLASVAANEVRVWDPRGLRDDVIYSRHGGAILTLAALPDGRIVSAGTDAVHVWDPERLDDRAAVYDGHQGSVLAVLPLADGRIASAGTDAVHVWDPVRPDQTDAVYSGHQGPVLTLAALSDGRVASGGTDSTVQLWDPDNTAFTELTYSGHNGGVATIVELSDRRIASAGPDTTVQVWDTTGALTEATFREHSEPVYRVLALPGGWVASAGEDRAVQIWNPDDQER